MGDAGLIEEWTRAGNWLFRWRGHLPLLVLIFLMWVSYSSSTSAVAAGRLDVWELVGILIGVVGLGLRAWTVGHAPRGTSYRSQEPEATMLSTEGIYSVVRHPLYLGNFVLWIGVALGAGSIAAVVIAGLVFWIYNERIILAEERFLHGRFGSSFEEWARRTPSFIPRFSGWRPNPLSFSPRFALRRDHTAVYALIASTTVLEVAETVGADVSFDLALFWWVYFWLGTIGYVTLLVLKKKSTVLEVQGR